MSRSELIDRLWPRTVPTDADNLLSTHVGRLRRWLDAQQGDAGPSLIPRSVGGYRVDLSRAQLDVRDLRELRDMLRQLSTAGQSEWENLRSTLVSSAYDSLGQLRPPAATDERLLNVLDDAWRIARQLCELVLASSPSRLSGAGWSPSDRGAGAGAVRRADRGLVADLSGGHRPDRGGVGGLPLIVRGLREDLGVDPGVELRDAHAALLAGSSEPVDQPSAVEDRRQRQRSGLPLPPAGFAGRTAALDELLAGAGHERLDHGPRVVTTAALTEGRPIAVRVCSHLLGYIVEARQSNEHVPWRCCRTTTTSGVPCGSGGEPCLRQRELDRPLGNLPPDRCQIAERSRRQSGPTGRQETDPHDSAAASFGSTMPIGATMTAGSYARSGTVRTANRALDYYYELRNQSNGNPVLYKVLPVQEDSRSVWASRTSGAPGKTVLKSDGNLVVYGHDGKAKWSSGTSGLYDAPGAAP